MELVQGGELFELINQRGELEPKLARKYFQQLIEGVDYCHRRGVYHRDLKPENLLVDENGSLKITDFGVSSMKGGTSGNDLLYTACGTPYYAAPEIINGAKGGYSGVKIDAWSCGIILYLLLAGTLPFMNPDMGKLYEEISQCQVTYPHWISGEAKDLISHLLVKDPNERYSLDDVRRHSWFALDMEYVSMDGNKLFGSCTSPTSNLGVVSYENNGQVVSQESESNADNMLAKRNSVGLRKVNSMHDGQKKPNSDLQTKHLQEPAMQARDLSDFDGISIATLVKNALPGKTLERIKTVVTTLDSLDIDCCEDLLFLAGMLKDPNNLATWMETKSKLPNLTCMRLAAYLFSKK